MGGVAEPFELTPAHPFRQSPFGRADAGGEIRRATGDDLEAVKITGDDHVPGGAITWRANLRTGRGEGQIAETEFRNPRFIPGKLTILNPERIVFTWDRLGSVDYRRDD